MTFLINYCRAGNLSALLKDDTIPDALQGYAERLASLQKPSKPKEKRTSNSKFQHMDNIVLNMLVNYLNCQEDESCRWMVPDKWSLLSKSEAVGVSPVTSQATFYHQVEHQGVLYSTFTANQNNSLVVLKPDSKGDLSFGRIFSIFNHRRSLISGKHYFDTWVHIQSFPNLPAKAFNPFDQIKSPNVQAHLRLWGPTEDRLVKINEISAHCAWIMYKPGEIHESIKFRTIALVCMNR